MGSWAGINYTRLILKLNLKVACWSTTIRVILIFRVFRMLPSPAALKWNVLLLFLRDKYLRRRLGLDLSLPSSLPSKDPSDSWTWDVCTTTVTGQKANQKRSKCRTRWLPRGSTSQYQLFTRLSRGTSRTVGSTLADASWTSKSAGPRRWKFKGRWRTTYSATRCSATGPATA